MSKLSSRQQGSTRAFSLIEVMAAVLIGGILLAIALATYSGAIADAQVQSCRANLQAIANAEEQLKMKTSARTYATQLSALQGELPQTPLCPTGGTYTITISNGSAVSQSGKIVPAGDLVISCSDPTHGVFAPGIDTE